MLVFKVVSKKIETQITPINVNLLVKIYEIYVKHLVKR